MDWTLFLAVAGGVVAMLGGMTFIFIRMSAKNQAFGPGTHKTIGLVMFLPILLILAVVADFPTETLAALLGVTAGYVLSHGRNDEG